MRFFKFSLVIALLSAGFAIVPSRSAAAGLELSMGFSFNRSNYAAENFSWTRRWGFSVGYDLTELTQIELAFQDEVERTSFGAYEDTTFHDRIFSVSWVQNLLSKNFPIQPYVKAGVGQRNLDADGTYWYGRPPSQVDSVTGVVAAGVRLFVTRSFAVRAEATSYLTGGSISTWRDNGSVTFGISARL